MKSIVVLSGKGGVGKSSMTASLAIELSKKYRITCADCDVDASNLSLLFGLDTGSYEEWKPLSTNQAAVIDTEKCIGCRICVESCYFNALSWKEQEKKPELKKFGCEGCGVCELVCPTKAITLKDINNAFVGYARTDKGGKGFLISSAQLEPGNSGSGKVVSEVKKKARELSPEADIMIVDSAAGVGCPVIASVAGNDYALLVTEPTPSAYSDMGRALDVVDHFKIKKGIIINKYDINISMTEKIEEFAEANGIKIIARVPFDRRFVEAMNRMVPIIMYDTKYERLFKEIASKVIREMA